MLAVTAVSKWCSAGQLWVLPLGQVVEVIGARFPGWNAKPLIRASLPHLARHPVCMLTVGDQLFAYFLDSNIPCR